MVLALSMFALVLGAGPATSPDTASESAPPAVAAEPSAATSAGASDFDFDLLPPPPPPTALDLDRLHQVDSRRSMLRTHQILGLSTLALMTATVVLGQLSYNDMYGGGGQSGNLRLPHRILAYTTTGSFIATASFSLFAPTPYPKDHNGVDTAMVHKVANGVAAAGMVAQVALGFVTARAADAGNGRHLHTYARAHQVVGYATLASLATAACVWAF